MKDNEIIKALERIIKNFDGKAVDFMAISSAINLINRQQAEIKALTGRTAKQEATIERLEDVKEQLESDIINANMNLEHMTAAIERLQNLTEKDFEQTAISTVKRHQKWIEYRAIKEFAERFLKIVHDNHYLLVDQINSKDYGMFTIGIKQAVDETKKEMVGDME